MPNLLPQKEKEVLYRIYRMKMIILGLISISILICIAALLLLPSYLLSSSKLKSAKEDLALLKESVSYREGRNTESELKETEIKLLLIEPIKQNNLIESEILKILKNSPSGIAITSVNYRKIDSNSSQITLTGSADTRVDLINYEDALKRNSIYKEVDLPVGNLAKDQNLIFNINISL